MLENLMRKSQVYSIMKGKFPLRSKVCTLIIFGWYFWCEDQVASVSTFQAFYSI